MVRKILLFVALIGSAGSSFSQTAALPLQSCVNGATQALVSDLKSTNYLASVIPSCTVTIYNTGTTVLATYYLSQGGSPQTGPFTASSTGQWLAYAATNQGYDVVLSGGIGPNTYPSPFTVTGLYPGGGGSSSFTALSGDAISTSTGGATTVVGIEGHAIAVPSTAGFVHWSGSAWEYTNPSGSGTVNSGTTGQLAYYAANGATVSGASIATLGIAALSGAAFTGAVSSGVPILQDSFTRANQSGLGAGVDYFRDCGGNRRYGNQQQLFYCWGANLSKSILRLNLASPADYPVGGYALI
jgi:hypothetical protein